jgi:hypothetical protein
MCSAPIWRSSISCAVFGRASTQPAIDRFDHRLYSGILAARRQTGFAAGAIFNTPAGVAFHQEYDYLGARMILVIAVISLPPSSAQS